MLFKAWHMSQILIWFKRVDAITGPELEYLFDAGDILKGKIISILKPGLEQLIT